MLEHGIYGSMKDRTLYGIDVSLGRFIHRKIECQFYQFLKERALMD